MSDAITRVGQKPAAVPTVKDARTEKLEKAAGEFETIFVKQLLKEAKVGGEQKSGGGYGDMAVDALASGIQKGGGLGLAKRIEQALASHHTEMPALTNGTSPAVATHVAALPPQPATRAAKR
jgi:Rod binding domain-containing protein